MKQILVVVAVFAMLMVPVVSASDLGTLTTVSYTYDGYCDGATLDIANGRVTGVASSPCASCPFTNQLNGRVGRQNGVIAAGFTYNPDWFGGYTVVRGDHTWTHYYFDGTVLNSGTWTQCLGNAPVAATKSSIS